MFNLTEITNTESGSPLLKKKPISQEELTPRIDHSRGYHPLNAPEILPPIDFETNSLITELFSSLTAGYKPVVVFNDDLALVKEYEFDDFSYLIQ